MQSPKGSLWRRWDLHVHTPSSYDYHDKGLSNEQIIDGLVAAGIRVAAVTDHNVIDIDRIRALQKLGDGRITTLPGIELVSELGGSSSVHFIGLFHEDSDLEYVWNDLSVKLKLTHKDIKSKGGHERVYVPIRDAAELIHSHGGLVSVHAGKKSNSLESVSSQYLFKRAIKTDLIKDRVIDILEIGNVEDDRKLYYEIVFPTIEEHLPLVLCSDNHRISEYKQKQACWIKADPGFYGLLQTLVEPEERIFIGEEPKKRTKVARNKTKYIQSVAIRKKEDSDLDEVWFDHTALDLNHDLVAIIGNKGSGKSALAEVIGLLGNSQNEPSFDFLSKHRFRTPKYDRSQHFRATLTWVTGTSENKTLDQAISPNQRERVKFIPQGLFEEICNDIAAGNENKFNEELEKVIFSHVSEPDRLGKSSLKDLLEHLTSETFDAIAIVKKQLHGLNEAIASNEEKLSTEYRHSLESLLEDKKKELEAHELAKPLEVAKPNETQDAGLTTMAEKLKEIKAQRQELAEQLEEARKNESQYALLVSSADKALEQIENFQEEYLLFTEKLSEPLLSIEVPIEEVITFELKTETIEAKRKLFENERLAAHELQNSNDEQSLPQKIEDLDATIQELQAKLDEPTRLYEAYLTEQEQWKSERLELIGNPSKNGTITYLTTELNTLAEMPARLSELKQQRLELVQKIYRQIQRLVEMYSDLYQPVQAFSNEFGLSGETFDLKFDVSVVDVGLEDKFFNWVAKNRIGSFYGDGEESLKKLVEQYDFNEWAQVESFLNGLVSRLHHDYRQSDQPEVKVIDQLKKGQNQDVVSLYDYIYSLDYLRPRYVLKLDEKELGQLSPGERGTLLLVFYLLVDKDDIPLIIDQPEENLDNQTVYQRLVHAIKVAKERRQIIIVTHNPNLAVVCDAEQIICCAIDKKNGNTIEYMSGAIENPKINAQIIDILEGTKPAFNNRRAKYAPFENLRAVN